MVSSIKIGKALRHENMYVEAMARDLFALGCKMHADGDSEAGRKTVWCALQGAAGADRGVQLDIL